MFCQRGLPLKGVEARMSWSFHNSFIEVTGHPASKLRQLVIKLEIFGDRGNRGPSCKLEEDSGVNSPIHLPQKLGQRNDIEVLQKLTVCWASPFSSAGVCPAVWPQVRLHCPPLTFVWPHSVTSIQHFYRGEAALSAVPPRSIPEIQYWSALMQYKCIEH